MEYEVLDKINRYLTEMIKKEKSKAKWMQVEDECDPKALKKAQSKIVDLELCRSAVVAEMPEPTGWCPWK